MRATIFVIMTVLGLYTTNALAECLGEAQIIAKAGEIRSHDRDRCIVEINESSISFYQTNKICPLQKSAALRDGIVTGIKDGHDCELQAGDSVNGTLVQSTNGIVLVDVTKVPTNETQKCISAGHYWGTACSGSGQYGEVYEGCLVPSFGKCPQGWTYRTLEYGNGSSAICGISPLKLINTEASGC